jgi:hypothetical protein
MRLLNATTLKLHEFFGSDIPSYFILSHRWEGAEITYQDVRDGTNTESAGWTKVRNACAFTRDREVKERRRRGLISEVAYIWIDTCCIDKSSSSELTEAINSMFSWYKHAYECLVYLKDVPSGLGAEPKEKTIGQSEWFKRGWTLQELLAPRSLVFISSDWGEVLGSRTDFSSIILGATGIQEDDFKALSKDKVSVARRMSWASGRTCTRVEDEAYCLMGLFGVNMPLLYGEGSKAFQRLQAEILKDSDDESIFAWWRERITLKESFGMGLLAPSPQAFKYSSEVQRHAFDRDAKPYSMTNKGLQITPLLMNLQRWANDERYIEDLDGEIPLPKWQQKHLHAIALNCFLEKKQKDMEPETDPPPIILILRRMPDSSNTYCRQLVKEIKMTPPLNIAIVKAVAHGSFPTRETIFIRAPGPETRWPSIERDPDAPDENELAFQLIKPKSTNGVVARVPAPSRVETFP